MYSLKEYNLRTIVMSFGAVIVLTGICLAGGVKSANAEPEAKAAKAGSLSKAVIQSVVKKNADEIRGCYEAELANNKELSGRMNLSWLVGSDGSVFDVVVSENTMHDKGVEACVVRTVGKWKFPAPKNGGQVRIEYPFVFESNDNKPDAAKAAKAGSLSKAVIQSVVKKNADEIRGCYEAELANNKELSGKMNLSWSVGSDGSVYDVVVSDSTMHDKVVEACVVRTVEKWKFPAPKNGGQVRIEYPFVFKSKAQE